MPLGGNCYHSSIGILQCMSRECDVIVCHRGQARIISLNKQLTFFQEKGERKTLKLL